MYNDGFNVRAISMGSALANAASGPAVDVTSGTGFAIQFHVDADIVADTVFEVWGDIPSVADSCVPSGIPGNQALLQDNELCYPGTNTPTPMRVTIPALTKKGVMISGRPRCLPFKFVFLKAISGSTALVSTVGVVSRLK